MLPPSMTRVLSLFDQSSRRRMIALACGIVAIVAVFDYLTGYELTFSLFYLGAVALGAWFVSARFALGISIVSLILGFVGDILAGATEEKVFISGWNAALAFGSYLVVVFTLSALRSLHNQLERKVLERTAALTGEMAKREGLEKALLAVSEREQRRIGHDLHDSLCQHLTATAIACEVMRERLEQKGQPEAADARKAIELIQEGISLARGLARGLAPVALEAEGLMVAFKDMAETVSERFRVQCRFHCPDPVFIHDSVAAGHLFRIAQESVSNALRHGHAKHVTISLLHHSGGIVLTIEDDGIGIPSVIPGTQGMGMHIMRHRAQMIAGKIDFRQAVQGSIVECAVPAADGDLV